MLEIQCGIDSDHTARDVFDRFNLSRVVRWDAFRKWAGLRRRDRRQRREVTIRTDPPDLKLPVASRGRWGARGIAGLRRRGMRRFDGHTAQAIVWHALLELGEDLRRTADRVIDIAGLLLKLTSGPADSDGNERPGAPGGDGPVPERRECDDTRGVLHAEPDSGREGS